MKKGLLVIMSGPSGVGKGTVRAKVQQDPALNLAYSISMTTRSMRPGEENGRDYYFVSKEEFQRNIDSGNLLEWAEFVGNRYGTPKDKVDALLDEGYNVLLEIEVQGASQVMRKYQKDEYVSIFVLPPSFEALEARIRGRRTEAEEIVQQRLSKARGEMNLAANYDYAIVNDSVDEAAATISRIIKDKMSH